MAAAKKRIEAIVRPQKFDDVLEALHELGIPGITVTEVKGFGRSAGKHEIYRGSAYVVDFVPKLKLELVVLEALAPQIVDIIAAHARTGKIGDGKVFVSEVERIARIRTGEVDDDAL
jgi:nitrogen regulatory protein P-II 1